MGIQSKNVDKGLISVIFYFLVFGSSGGSMGEKPKVVDVDRWGKRDEK